MLRGHANYVAAAAKVGDPRFHWHFSLLPHHRSILNGAFETEISNLTLHPHPNVVMAQYTYELNLVFNTGNHRLLHIH